MDTKTRREFGSLVVATGLLAGMAGSAKATTTLFDNIQNFFDASAPLSEQQHFVGYVLRNLDANNQPHWTNWATDKSEFMGEMAAVGIVFEEVSGDGGDLHAMRIYDAIRTMNGENTPETGAPSTQSAWVQLGNLYLALVNGNDDGTFLT